MCGIIGYTGVEEATRKVTRGLEILEYRGYDSVGICARGIEGIKLLKTKGRVSRLEEALAEKPISQAFCAIGHTRWATHGAPSDVNAHPHNVGKTFLVHNGIVENYKELKAELEREGVSFLSETDTEVGCALVNKYFEELKDPYAAISKAVSLLHGSYAFAIMFEGEGDTIYAVRSGSPLIIAKGTDGYYLASDITALISFTREYYSVTEGEIIKLTKDTAEIFGKGEPTWKITEMTFESAKKDGYEHFMLKEMFEQPKAIKSSVSSRIKNGLPDFSVDGIGESFMKDIDEIHIVACGSAMHAGIVGSSIIERLASVPSRAYVASEYRYSPPLAGKNTLVVIISQSGETADSLASLRYAKSAGFRTFAIVNAVETTIAREAHYRSYTYAGPEIAVATTKGYATQVSLLCLFAVALARAKGKINDVMARELTECIFTEAPDVAAKTLARRDEIKDIALRIYKREDIFYIGRGLDYALSLEASLKLKEISYIHCEAYAAGELKHGTISLIEEGTPVIALATEERLFDKMDSNIKEVKSRGAYTVLVCTDKMKNARQCADLTFILPECSELGAIFGVLMAVQLISYEVSYLRGCDIDKPRNLAKSVTVE